MEKGARRTGKTAWEIAALYTEAFLEEMRLLNIEEPTILCRATDHIAEQIAFIAAIEAKGYTYRTSDGIYFDTSKQPDYGFLARLDKEGLEAGKRVDLGEKRHPTDFALWKFSPAGEQRQMEWESPWGRGFPGWHIECSAMAEKYLGDWFDIHCGGEDHISVHHTNEIAQTEAKAGTRLANFWMHGYFLLMNDAKMAKSAGGFLRVASLVDKGYDPLAYRYLCLTGHYRSQLNFTWDALDAAQTGLDRMRHGFHALAHDRERAAGRALVARFGDHLNDDLNLPRALAVAWEALRGELAGPVRRATLAKFDEVLGLGLADWAPRQVEVPADVQRAGRGARGRAQGEAVGGGGPPARRAGRGGMGHGRPRGRLRAEAQVTRERAAAASRRTEEADEARDVAGRQPGRAAGGGEPRAHALRRGPGGRAHAAARARRLDALRTGPAGAVRRARCRAACPTPCRSTPPPRWRRCRAPTSGRTAPPTSTTSSWCAARAGRRCRRSSGPTRSCTRARPTTCSAPARTSLLGDEAWGIDFEGEVAVITGDVPMGTGADAALVARAPAGARQRRQPAQPDSRRAREGLRLLPEQARLVVLAGRRHARRAGRGVARRTRAPAARLASQRRALRPSERRRGHDLPLRPADRARREDARAGRRQHRGIGHRVEQGERRARAAGRAGRRRLLVHRRAAHGRDAGRQASR